LIFAISISKVRRIHFLLSENETAGNKIDEQQKYITRLEQKLLQFTGRGDYPKKNLTSKEKSTDFVSNLESSENKQKHNKGRPKVDQRYFRKKVLFARELLNCFSFTCAVVCAIAIRTR
jgi:hypothetical protein